MISACRDCLKPLVFNGKGPIFTTFYAKGLQALKVLVKMEKFNPYQTGLFGLSRDRGGGGNPPPLVFELFQPCFSSQINKT